MKKIIPILTIISMIIMYYNSPKNIQNIEVDTIKPSFITINNSVSCKGSIEANNYRYLSSNENGEIKKLYVKTGDVIKTGDKIADIVINNRIDIENDILSAMNLIMEGEIINTDNIVTSNKKGENITLYSNFDGTIMNINKDIGEYVNKNIPFIKISDISKLKVIASISENNIASVQVGMSAEITGDAFSGKTYIGEVIEIMPYAKTGFDISGTKKPAMVEAIINISNSDSSIKPGFTTNVKIITDSVNNATVLPYETIIRENDKEFVFSFKNNKIIKQEIITGYEIEQGIQIEQGVLMDSDIVINPEKTFKNGDKAYEKK